jgi:hypothetical protein
MGMPFRGLIYLGANTIVTLAQSIESTKSKGLSSTLEFAQIAASIQMKYAGCNMTPHHLAGDNYQPKPTVDPIFIRKL